MQWGLLVCHTDLYFKKYFQIKVKKIRKFNNLNVLKVLGSSSIMVDTNSFLVCWCKIGGIFFRSGAIEVLPSNSLRFWNEFSVIKRFDNSLLNTNP